MKMLPGIFGILFYFIFSFLSYFPPPQRSDPKISTTLGGRNVIENVQ